MYTQDVCVTVFLWKSKDKFMESVYQSCAQAIVSAKSFL